MTETTSDGSSSGAEIVGRMLLARAEAELAIGTDPEDLFEPIEEEEVQIVKESLVYVGTKVVVKVRRQPVWRSG
jgi:hypothetical protein